MPGGYWGSESVWGGVLGGSWGSHRGIEGLGVFRRVLRGGRGGGEDPRGGIGGLKVFGGGGGFWGVLGVPKGS